MGVGELGASSPWGPGLLGVFPVKGGTQARAAAALASSRLPDHTGIAGVMGWIVSPAHS